MLIDSLKSMEHVMLNVISFEQSLHDVTVVFKRTHLFAACYRLVVGVVHLSFASVVALNSLDNNLTVVTYKSGSIIKQESNGRIVLTIKSISLSLVNK